MNADCNLAERWGRLRVRLPNGVGAFNRDVRERFADFCLPTGPVNQAAPRKPAGRVKSVRADFSLRYNVSLTSAMEYVMAVTSMVHVRVDESIKNQAAETLASMGLTVSDAVRVFLTRVVTDQQLPFALQAPNASTRAAMREARAISKARYASAVALIHDLEEGTKR